MAHPIPCPRCPFCRHNSGHVLRCQPVRGTQAPGASHGRQQHENPHCRCQVLYRTRLVCFAVSNCNRSSSLISCATCTARLPISTERRPKTNDTQQRQRIPLTSKSKDLPDMLLIPVFDLVAGNPGNVLMKVSGFTDHLFSVYVLHATCESAVVLARSDF